MPSSSILVCLKPVPAVVAWSCLSCCELISSIVDVFGVYAICPKGASLALISAMVHAGCVFVSGIHLSRTGVSGSFECIVECMCAQTRPWY